MGHFDCDIRADIAAVLLKQIAPFRRARSGFANPVLITFPLAVAWGCGNHKAWVFDAI